MHFQCQLNLNELALDVILQRGTKVLSFSCCFHAARLLRWSLGINV